MKYFKEEEFRGWFKKLSPELKTRLDEFREELGYPVKISPARGTIGRHSGRATSRHNVDRYGEVQAIDLMPAVIEPERWIEVAEKVGFKGIGIYPEWRPQAGIHVDIRGGRLATWGALRRNGKQVYTSLRYALRFV